MFLSGAKAERHDLDLMIFETFREGDTVIVWKLDRIVPEVFSTSIEN